jgi:hypothetical protein
MLVTNIMLPTTTTATAQQNVFGSMGRGGPGGFGGRGGG